MSTLGVLAIDLGGTTTKGALIDADGRWLARVAVATPAADGQAVTDTVLACLGELAEAAAVAGVEVVGAGILSPGVVDADRGLVVYASNLALRDVDLGALVRARFDVAVAVGHDVRGAALAEQAVGRARDSPDFALIMLGTGIASALWLDGSLRLGVTGAAGEIGHIPVIADGEPCNCGQSGCLEVYASAAGVARRYAAAGGTPGTSAAQVAGLLGADDVADRVWAEAVDALGLGLATLTLLTDPGLIVIGGGLSNAGPALLEPTVGALSGRLRWRDPPTVALSPLGDSAGRVGAAVLAMQAAGLGDRITGWPAPRAVPGSPAPGAVPGSPAPGAVPRSPEPGAVPGLQPWTM